MTFVKHTFDDGAAITPAALALSGLDGSEMLELQALNKAVVLFEADMDFDARVALATQFMRMANALIADVSSEHEEDAEEDVAECECSSDVFAIPYIALEAAGLADKNLHLFTDDGIVVIVENTHDFNLSPHTREKLHRHDITPENFCRMFSGADEDDD